MVVEGHVTISGQSVMGSLKVPDCDLSTDLNELLENGNFSDFTLIVGDQRFPVHKSMLAARSPVFAAMFGHHEMEESKQGEATIKDLEPEVLKEMLKYIYTGKVTQLESMADELLAAADKVSCHFQLITVN